MKQMVIIEARDRKLSPHVEIVDKNGKVMAGGTILPESASLVVTDKQKVQRGQTLVKIQKDVGKSRDITGGLPRVAELKKQENLRTLQLCVKSMVPLNLGRQSEEERFMLLGPMV